MPGYIKAPIRRRSRRIQKKIDKRFGLLRCDRQAIYILMLSDATRVFEKIVKDGTLNDLARQMGETILEATQRLKGNHV